jgi:hypothetical protein
MRTAWVAIGCAILLMTVAVPAFALEKVADGVYALDPKSMDDVLELGTQPDLKVLLIGDTDPKATSEAHTASLRKWVENGGVIWVWGDAAESPLIKMVDKEVKAEKFEFKKSSTGKQGGELVARNVSDKLIIHDHPLTQGVDQLYIQPAYKYDGTRGMDPVVEMTDAQGNHGVVLGTLKLGQGTIVLDGTRRTGADVMFWKKKGFDKEHPHAVKSSSGEWNSYDWDRLLQNAKALYVYKAPPRTSS